MQTRVRPQPVLLIDLLHLNLATCTMPQAKDEEFGVTRGIDFKGVNTVINFDMPASTQG